MHLLTGLCSLPSKFLVQQPTLYPSGHFSLLFLLLFFFFTVYIVFVQIYSLLTAHCNNFVHILHLRITLS